MVVLGVLTFLVYFGIVSTSAPTCQTTCGPVAGIHQDGAYSFRGIPYAEPPVGTLRWKPPKALSREAGTCWNGTFLAQQYGNTCYQRDIFNHTKHEGSEDCLYLNVFTPTLDSGAIKPVMVWLHGGYLEYLNGNWPTYSPTEKISSDTDIVYVSLNYRLHAFGFLALQLLENESETNTSGNYGFMDMILALQWVQSNIKNFGGDPNQVTVFGQSSGGTSIFALLASPLCRNLFHKAWLISGSPILNKTAADAYKDNEVFLKNSNCTSTACLYALSSAEVTSSVPWTVYPYWEMDDLVDLPTKGLFDGALAIVDGYVIPEAPFDAWSKGKLVDVPLLIGSCANENDFQTTYMDLKNWTWAQYDEHVSKSMRPFGTLIYETAKLLYPPGFITPEYQFTSMTSDIRVNCPTDVLAVQASATFKSSVYRYVVTSWPSQPINALGFPFPSSYSVHMWDVFAFFGCVKDYIKTPTQDDLRFQQNVRDEVLSFVHNCHPKSDSWQQYRTVTANLSSKTTVGSAFHPVQCEFWLKNGFYDYAWIN